MSQTSLPFAACIPALILLAAVFFERGQRKRRGERQPLFGDCSYFTAVIGS
jgi:hypothetical protein